MTWDELDAILERNHHLKIHSDTPRQRQPAAPPITALPRDRFDSDLEYRYYQRRLLPAILTGHIVGMEIHRSFEIVPPVPWAGKTLKARVYTPDFVTTWRDGSIEVVEVKHSKVKKNQRDYPLRRQLFLVQYVIPNGWRFFEYSEHDL